MKWETEIPSPSSYHSISSSNWLVEESKSSRWTASENKMFENALAVYDKDTPDRWHKVAAMIPGKTVGDVMKQYKELEDDVSDIEAGLIPIPGYITSPFTLEWVNNDGFDGLKQSYGYGVGGKRSSNRPSDQERKKGVPWTEEEHKLFLMGLKKYGKGDWRNISRNFVITRTPTQVASHAQKYFIRQLSGGKDKRRASIHDITTVNLADTRAPLPENNKPSSPDHSGVLPQQPSSGAMTTRSHFHWNQLNGGATMAFNAPHVSSSPYGLNPYGLKMQGPKSVQESFFGSQNLMQPSPPNPHAVTHKGRGEYF